MHGKLSMFHPSISALTLLADVTHLLNNSAPFESKRRTLALSNVTLPNGVSMRLAGGRYFGNGAETAMISEGASISHTQLGNASIWTYFAMYWTGSNTDAPQAIEVSFYWCIKTYNATVVDNVIAVKRASPRIEIIDSKFGPAYHAISSLDGNDVYNFVKDEYTLPKILNTIMTGYTKRQNAEPFRGMSGSEMHLQATIEIKETNSKQASKENRSISAEEAQMPWWVAVNGIAGNTANGLTNS